VQSPDLSVEHINIALRGSTARIGREVVFLESVDSTNTFAARLAGEGGAEGTVVLADAQTGGKGRFGRTWLSPPGRNLYMSIIVRPVMLPGEAAVLTLMSAVACVSAIKKLTTVPVSIKWPNDILVSGRKLGGILTEIRADMDKIFHAVIGIGINVNLTTDDMPDDLKLIATSIKQETGTSFPRTLLAVGVLKEMDRWYGMFLEKGKKPVLLRWKELTSTIGQTVQVRSGAETITGIAEGIDDDGMLLIRLPGGPVKRVSSGEVAYMP